MNSTNSTTEIESKIPAASEIETKSPVNVEELIASLKTLEAPDLFRIIKQATLEAEKRMKTPAKKAGSMPKGKRPPQLVKPDAWVNFTLLHAQQNGWEPFIVHNKKTNEDIEMSGSVLHEDMHVFADSISQKKVQLFIKKHAMSLSKQRWANKTSEGTHPELYEEFLASYEDDSVSEHSASTPQPVVKMTAAEKEAEKEQKREEKRIAKEEEKERKKEERERVKEEKRVEKEATKEQKRLAKEEEKAAKSVKAVKPVVKAVVKAVAKPAVKAVTPAKPAVVAKPVAKPVKVVKAKPEWICPDDGMFHPWTWNGQEYLRDFENYVYSVDAEGAGGDYMGMYLAAEDRIDPDVPEKIPEDTAEGM